MSATPAPPPPRDPSEPKALADQPAGTVKVQKREVKVPDGRREKICATCGQTFTLAADEKFFNCPNCYRKTQPVRKAPRKSDAQILTQITCLECGTVEYLDFVPTDVNATYCHSCFSKRKQELQASRPHSERR